jgi:hypothetical protein
MAGEKSMATASVFGCSRFTCSQVENAARGSGNELEQRRFAFRAMRNRIRAFEVVEGVIGASPEINRHN